MRKIILAGLSALLALVSTPALEAQNDPKAEQKKPQAARILKLQKACRTTAGLSSLAFSTQHRKTHDAASARIKGLGKFRGRRVRTSGVWSNELLSQTFRGEEQVVFHGRRMIATDDDHLWTRRRGRRANGKDLGFVLDPRTLFTVLAGAKMSVIHNEVGTVGGKPVETYTITLDEDDALDLLWSGSVPTGKQSTSGGARGNFAQVFAARLGGNAPKPDVSLELAISFDPGTRLIHKIHGRAITKVIGNAFGANIVFGGAVRGRNQEDEEEEEEEVKPGTFKNGLTVHSKDEFKSATVVEFTYEFQNHDQASMVHLDARARRLLGLPAK